MGSMFGITLVEKVALTLFSGGVFSEQEPIIMIQSNTDNIESFNNPTVKTMGSSIFITFEIILYAFANSLLCHFASTKELKTRLYIWKYLLRIATS